MTLLNTVCNLGGNWLATLALWAGKNSSTIVLSCNYLSTCHTLIKIIFS